MIFLDAKSYHQGDGHRVWSTVGKITQLPTQFQSLVRAFLPMCHMLSEHSREGIHRPRNTRQRVRSHPRMVRPFQLHSLAEAALLSAAPSCTLLPIFQNNGPPM